MPRPPIDTDQWWIERRMIARKLLDDDDAKTAYQITRNAAVPSRDNYRVEHQFTAGWIALRFLNDPATAQTHFSKIAQGISNPISLARASYWQGPRVRSHGPPAGGPRPLSGRRSVSDCLLRADRPRQAWDEGSRAASLPERHGSAQHEVVRAIDLLYAVGERDLIEACSLISESAHNKMPPCSPHWVTLRPATRMPAPRCCLVRVRSGGDCRSTTTPFR
jgi:soluble lytic murein transglycosylase